MRRGWTKSDLRFTPQHEQKIGRSPARTLQFKTIATRSTTYANSGRRATLHWHRGLLRMRRKAKVAPRLREA
jgi:hypothetical protein